MFTHLFTSLRIGNLEVPNRIVMLPMSTGFCEGDETVGNRFINFFTARARGGAGLIVIPFSPIADGSPVVPGVFDDRFLPGIRRLTAAIGAQGAKSACQLILSYHVIFRDHLPEVVAPSPVLNQLLHVVPRAVTIEEIRFIVEEYGKAARRAREGGFDAVEILVGGGYLLNRFLSPVSNKRDDEYGGTLENRMRILLEIIVSVQKDAGDDFPISVRLNIEEQMPGGHTVEDSLIVAKALENAGGRLINAYTGWHEAPVPTVAPSLPKGAFAHLAGKIRSCVGIPVITANRINDPFVAEKILVAGQADLIGMGRALLADPELPNKAKSGRVEEIVPCLACSRCLGEILTIYKVWGERVSTFCTVNPLAGKESQGDLRPAGTVKNVCIVGGGPAGLEAARTAALRGHKVILFEKESETGGWLRVGCLPPHKEEIRTLALSMAVRAQKAGAEIRLCREAGPQTIVAEKPDVLVLALGAASLVPPIPGVHGSHVVLAEDVLTGRKTVRGSVIVIGGGLVGCETAEFLVERDARVTAVTVLEMLDHMAAAISPTYRPFFIARLKKMGVRMETKTTVEEITPQGVRVNRRGRQEFIAGEAVIIAAGLKADPAQVGKFRGVAPEIYAIGDCVQPRMIKEAIEEGFSLGTRI